MTKKWERRKCDEKMERKERMSVMKKIEGRNECDEKNGKEYLYTF
jgi:hypothetical protein